MEIWQLMADYLTLTHKVNMNQHYSIVLHVLVYGQFISPNCIQDAGTYLTLVLDSSFLAATD